MTSPAIERSASAAPAGQQQGFVSRLTTGTGAFNVIGRRRTYYLASVILVVLAALLITVRGFNFGIEFAGGTKLQLPATASAGQSITNDAVSTAIQTSTGINSATVQTVGTGASATIQVRLASLTADQVVEVKQALSQTFGIPIDQVSDSAVSETWGGEISQRAVIALFVFLVAVSIFLWLRYERRVAIGAVVAVFHDLVITAGIYSLIGFEVTPATVIGLLAILGFSLYDTVVVYDKVQENTKGLTSLLRRNYEEASNLAINQTLMRSVNTTVIALLPVAGLLVAGVAILGSGTLKDLALVQLVGMIVSGYSSVFLAVPIAVELRLRDPLIKAHTARVAARRKNEGLIVDAVGDPTGRRGTAVAAVGTVASGPTPPATASSAGGGDGTRTPPSTPRPGVKPQRSATARPSGKSSRPTGKRER